MQRFGHRAVTQLLQNEDTSMTDSQFSIVSVGDSDLRIRCATKSHVIYCMTSGSIVSREGSDRRRRNISRRRNHARLQGDC